MSLVIAKELNLAYGKKVLLDGTSFSIGPTDRIGLVGPNGTGKSSLLKILALVQAPDSGTLTIRRKTRISYLPQEIASLPTGSVVDAVLSAVPGRDELEAQVESLQSALEAASEEAEQLELSQSLSDLHAELDHFEERHGRHHAQRILAGLGFTERDLDKPTSALSGGWRMRAALAGLLLQDPDLLLLDEPTNHLDVPSLTWFDGFLRRSQKAMVLISHDRDFLNRQVGRILSLEVEGLRSYVGNYDQYKRLRAEELEQLTAQAGRQEAKRAELQGFIDRFGAKASKARQAQSRAKQLEKMEVIEIAQERATVHFRFPEVARSGRDVLTVDKISKRYAEHILYDGFSAAVERGQKIAVIGANGAGKSTLLKMVAGELVPDAGEVRFGHNVVLGYYAQHHADTLDRKSTVLAEVARIAPTRGQGEIRSVLGSFLFSGDDVEKPIGVLSGGERARVALARLLLIPANFLLMDEPTNHLDLDSSEMLIEALKSYGGTLLFVSHNRSFINQLSTHVWDVRDGSVQIYPGNLDDYLYHQQQALAEQGSPATQADSAARAGTTDKERRRLDAEARKKHSTQLLPLKREVQALEAKVALVEAEQREHEAELAKPAVYEDFPRARKINEEHGRNAAKLKALYEKWELVQAELEGLVRAAGAAT